jgi:hypothetical protein
MQGLARTLACFLACAAANWSQAATVADDWPERFTASYMLHNNGLRVAAMERSFETADDGIRVFRSETRTVGLLSLLNDGAVIEQTRWRDVEGRITPLLYEYDRTGDDKARSVTVRFDAKKDRISNTVDEETWHMALEPQTFDKLLYQVALMRDLAAGQREFNYRIADGGRIKIYHIVTDGEDIVETPLGRLQALKLRRVREDSSRETIFWCVPALRYLPVRVEIEEKNGSVTTAVLKSYTGLPALPSP